MGACGCKPVLPIVHVPLPATLGEFDRFSQENTYTCVEYLNEVRAASVGQPPEMSRLCGPYAVEVVAATGKKTEVAVNDVAEEVNLVYRLLTKQKAKGKKFKPLGDVRREACLCAANLRALKRAPLYFTDEVIFDFVNAQLPLPLTTVQITVLCEVFNKMNVSRTGVVNVLELTEWASHLSPSILYSCFLFAFLEVVTSKRLHLLNIVEMIAAIDRFCVMNEEQLLRTVFEVLADTHNSAGSRAMDITSVMNRFPVPNADGGKYVGMPLLKALSKLYTKRLSTDTADRAHLLVWEDWQRLSQTALPAFSQLRTFQQCLREQTLGHKVWNRRRRQLERLAMDGSNVVPLKGTWVKTFYLRPRREVKSVYTVLPLQEHGSKRSEMSDRLGSDSDTGSDSEDDAPLRTSRSMRSTRSRRSVSSRRSSARNRRDMRRSRPGSSASHRSKYLSPANLSPRATRDFESAMKQAYGPRSGSRGRTARSGGSPDRDYRRSPSSNRMRGSPSRRHLRNQDRLSSPSSASYEGSGNMGDSSPRAVSPLLPPERPQVAVPLPGGPPPAGHPGGMPPTLHQQFGGPVAAGPPPHMYAGNGGAPPASFHVGAGYGGVPTPEMMAYRGPPRAQSFSGPATHARPTMSFQRASLPGGPPPPGQRYYFPQ